MAAAAVPLPLPVSPRRIVEKSSIFDDRYRSYTRMSCVNTLFQRLSRSARMDGALPGEPAFDEEERATHLKEDAHEARCRDGIPTVGGQRRHHAPAERGGCRAPRRRAPVAR